MPAAHDDAKQKPVIFLAFAQDRMEGGAYLRNLPVELDGIRKALQKARHAGLCEVQERAKATVENILDVFQEYQDRIAIFHYGGHADSYELLLESFTGEHAIAHSAGLVSFLAKQKGVQLIFLNGCCRQQQALDLVQAGIPAVVGTSKTIDDAVATDLSVRFYKGLTAGRNIGRAWTEVVDQVKIEKGADWRALYWKGKTETPDRFPWEISMSLVEPEKHGEWYIDTVCDRKQWWIWTADESTGLGWHVYFHTGYCSHHDTYANFYVRAVR